MVAAAYGGDHDRDVACPGETETTDGVAAVARFLLLKAREDARRVRAEAAADAGTALARARAEADTITADARAAGAAEGAVLVSADLAEARRRARAIVLGARREVYEELRRGVGAAAYALRADRALMNDLRRLAHDTAGPGAQVTAHPDGGFVATGPGTRVDCSLPALADRAVDALGGEVERLWES